LAAAELGSDVLAECGIANPRRLHRVGFEVQPEEPIRRGDPGRVSARRHPKNAVGLTECRQVARGRIAESIECRRHLAVRSDAREHPVSEVGNDHGNDDAARERIESRRLSCRDRALCRYAGKVERLPCGQRELAGSCDGGPEETVGIDEKRSRRR